MDQEESPTGTETDNFQLNMILGSSSFYKTSEILQVTDHKLYFDILLYESQATFKQDKKDVLNTIMGKISEKSKITAASKKKNESGKLLNLLKKTQMQVSSLENEIKRIEAENIHQDS